MDDVEGAITREEVRKLIHEKIIVSLPEKGVSSSRAKVIRGKKRLRADAVVQAASQAQATQRLPRKKLG